MPTDLKDVDRIAWRRYGTGPAPIIALHGFSRDGGIFGGLGRRLAQTHVIHACDLPYHGSTQWSAPRYDAKEVAGLIRDRMISQGIERANFLGHSLGGRLLLKVLGGGLLPAAAVRGLVLVAPDGLRGNYTGKLDKLPGPLVRALAWAGGRRDALLRLARLLHRRGLFDRYTLQYLEHHLRDERTQKMLLGTFRSLPAFRLGAAEQRGLASVPKILALVGDRDPLMNREAVSRWFAPLEQAVVRPYAGHHSLPLGVLEGYLRGN